ncbi:hypothetical protein F4778DRAFT_719579 [Xylariomycetidae sp. FL2044]|nr:hypothetical protein F4778DRAFT_719579 [Xylariomycetidae sp. FL2044]
MVVVARALLARVNLSQVVACSPRHRMDVSGWMCGVCVVVCGTDGSRKATTRPASFFFSLLSLLCSLSGTNKKGKGPKPRNEPPLFFPFLFSQTQSYSG